MTKKSSNDWFWSNTDLVSSQQGSHFILVIEIDVQYWILQGLSIFRHQQTQIMFLQNTSQILVVYWQDKSFLSSSLCYWWDLWCQNWRLDSSFWLGASDWVKMTVLSHIWAILCMDFFSACMVISHITIDCMIDRGFFMTLKWEKSVLKGIILILQGMPYILKEWIQIIPSKCTWKS